MAVISQFSAEYLALRAVHTESYAHNQPGIFFRVGDAQDCKRHHYVTSTDFPCLKLILSCSVSLLILTLAQCLF